MINNGLCTDKDGVVKMSLYDLEEIKQAKMKLGFSNDTSTVFLADLIDKAEVVEWSLIGPALSPLVAKHYVGSFEQDGILLLEATITYKVKSLYLVVPYDSIQSITFSRPSKGMMLMSKGNFNFQSLIITTTYGSKIQLSVYKRVLGNAHAWVRNNVSTIHSIIDGNKLPIVGAGSKQKIQTTHLSGSSAEHILIGEPAFCSNCGTKIAPHQLYCGKCGAKLN